MLPRPWPFLLTTYDHATKDPEKEFGRLLEAWQLPMPADLVARAASPSGTTDRGSQLVAGVDARSGWEKLLDADDVDRILRVVRAFGLDFYTDDRMPDAERLLGPSVIGPAVLP